MTEEKKSYRQIMKATSIFGGVQIFTIIIALIRSKFIAVLLGPAGIGIVGLFTVTTGLVSGLTNFGLGTSAVRDVASADATGNNTRVAIVVKVLRRWVWLTGILGTVVMLIFSSLLSELTFSNRNYTLAFVWLSITMLFTQLSSGQLVVLQGLRKLQYLAKASLLGSVVGLIITIPLYYWLRIDGIVPAIIIASLVALVFSGFYARKVNIEKVRVSRIRTIAEGKKMLYLGYMISLSGLITMGSSYLVRIFINRTGGFTDVGLYSAGFAIISTYVGLIFTAMGKDFYPRLSAVSHSNELCKQTINQQVEIAILILSPILMVFMVFIQWVVIILYSNKFVAINEMIHWAALGMFFRTASWAMGFILLAKSASRLFLITELISNVYFLGLNLLGYYLFGLTGLGLSFFIGYFFHVVQLFLTAKIKYKFSFDSAFIRIYLIQFLLAIICLILAKTINKPYFYIVGTCIIIVSSWFSFVELERRLGIRNVIIKSLKRFGL